MTGPCTHLSLLDMVDGYTCSCACGQPPILDGTITRQELALLGVLVLISSPVVLAMAAAVYAWLPL